MEWEVSYASLEEASDQESQQSVRSGGFLSIETDRYAGGAQSYSQADEYTHLLVNKKPCCIFRLPLNSARTTFPPPPRSGLHIFQKSK